MNLLITGAWKQAPEHFETLRQMGHSICFLQQEKDDLPCDPTQIEGVICNGLFLYHPITCFPNLRYIQLTSAGTDRVPMDYIKEHDITLHNARGVYSIPMAEFAMAGVLSLYKDLFRFKENQQQHQWQKNRELRELTNKRVLIVGCGSVGTECAKRFRAFGCQITGIDIQPFRNENFDIIDPLTELDRHLPEADILILTVPLTKETTKLIDQGRLEMLKDDAILINISRGTVIDQKALETWNGQAILDVFEEEPLPADSPLWKKENWIITPHNCFISDGNADRLAKLILQNLRSTDE